MYDVIFGTPKDVFYIYLIFFVACFSIYPIAIIIMNSVLNRRRNKWD